LQVNGLCLIWRVVKLAVACSGQFRKRKVWCHLIAGALESRSVLACEPADEPK
jgi:hypothetical protein